MNPRGVKALRAFAKGLARLEIGYKIVTLPQAKPSEDPMICWGVFKTKLQDRKAIHILQKLQQIRGGELIILERGFVRREDYYMVGFDDLNGRGSYPETLPIPDRWDALGVELKEWQEWNGGEGEILVIGQVPWDTACQHVDQTVWVHTACRALRDLYPNYRVVFRPHPLQPTAIKKCVDIDRMDVGRDLDEALRAACLVVTFSSTVGVDATIAGVPVIACDRTSMVYEICTNDLRATPIKPYREAWAYRLAYKQWTLDEMAKGLPWEHLHEEN